MHTYDLTHSPLSLLQECIAAEDGAELLGTVVAGHSSSQRQQSRAVAAGKDYPPAAGTETGRMQRGAEPSNTI